MTTVPSGRNPSPARFAGTLSLWEKVSRGVYEAFSPTAFACSIAELSFR